MKKLMLFLAICAGPVLADPLDLNDYAAFFAESADAVEVLSDTRSALSVGPVIVLRDTT